MKRKFIFLVMLFALLGGVNFSANAQETETIKIGSKTNTDARIPVHTWYNYSYTQQIYKASEINHAAGDILKIAFHDYITSLNRNVRVYMKNTTKSSFENLNDWVAISDSDLVYDGTMSTASTLVEIVLDRPFEYEGGNILLCLQDYTKQCPKATSFEIFNDIDSQNCTLLALDDGKQPGPDNPTGAAHELSMLKNVLTVTFSLATGPVIPAAPVVNAEPTGQNSIYLSWGSVYKATSYNVYEGDNLIAENITNPYYEVSGLTANTTYTYTVTATNENGTSEKSNEASATTWPLAPESAPANLQATNVGFNSITLSWNAVATAEYYTVYVNGSFLTEVDGTTYTVTNLNTDTEYTFTVTASNISGSSPASEALTVKTEKFEGRTIVFELNDYYGYGSYDGWNGNKLLVEFSDGTPSVEFTNTKTAASEFYEIQVSYGTTVTVTYLNTGSYGSENTYYIRYKDDNYLIHADGRAVNNGSMPSTTPFSFKIEIPAVQNLTATPAQIQKGQSTTISWDAYNGAATYNIYVNDELKGNTAELTYQLSEIPFENVIAVVALDANGEEISGTARISVKVAGTFTLNLHVVNADEEAIEGATVTFNTESFYNEFYELVPAIEAMTTDADGMISIELPLPCVYGAPLYTSSSLGVIVTKESYGTGEYWIYSGMSIKDGDVLENDITLELGKPTQLEADSYQLLAGDTLVMSWDAITSAIGYNVYKQGEWNESTYSYDYDKLNEEIISDTTYTINGVEYGMNVQYAVTAVYAELGESDYTTTTIDVTGMGEVLGTVKDGTNPVKGVKVVLTGMDEFGFEQTYNFTTDAEGKFYGEVMVGYDYTARATRYDYEDAEQTEIKVEYGGATECTIVMTSYPSATIAVTAAEAGNNALVSWTAEDEYEEYNVYRRNAETDAIEKLASNVTLKEYQDTQWASLENGTYQYGVSAAVGSQDIDAFNEDFQSSGWNMPEGWENIPGYYYYNGYQYLNYWSFDGNSGYTYFYAPASYMTANLNTPIIDLSNSTAATLSFDYKNTPYGNYGYDGTNTLYIKVKADGESNWTLIDNGTISGNVQSFTKCELQLDNYIGKKIQISFEVYTQAYATTTIDNVVITSSTPRESIITWSNELAKKSALTFNNAAEDNDWSNVDNWVGGVLPTANDNVIVAAEANINGVVAVNNLTISNAKLNVKSGTLTVNGTITDSNQYGSLYFEDGAQIFQNNEGVNAYFRMKVENPTAWDESIMNGWQFISSPLLGADIASAATKYDNAYNASDYDLYKYNGTADLEWVNHKSGNFETTFEQGRGYMYSHQARTIVTLGGTLNPARTHEYEVSYTEGEGNELANLHLLGNPFTFNMNWAEVNVTNVYDGFATLNEAGDDYVYATEGTINVGDGFFVQATGSDPAISYEKTRGSKETAANINVIARGIAGEDNVIINFAGEGEGFSKLQGFNKDKATVFVANNGRRYGIANVDENATEVELSFVASQMGNYSISLDVNGEFETVTLVDRFTGIETNMLLEDEYNFTATSRDNANRFVVKLVNRQQTTDNSQFVYQSGEELILSIEGTVQIVDMLGRVVYSNEHSNGDNRISVSEFNNAAYVVRVVNEEGVKSQKVVIY